MTAAVHKIAPPNLARHERDLALGKLVNNWEPDICDLAHMSDVAVTVLDAAISGGDATSSGFPGLVMLTTEQVDQIMFVAYQVSRMTTNFKDKYFEAITAE